MCGRIALGITPGYLRERFDEVASANILEEPGLLPRYNLTPSHFLPGIRATKNGAKEWAIFRWGLIPRWAKPDRIPDKTFNARSETVAEKPTFREAYEHRRCILPVSGYYEWTGVKGAKQPYYFYKKDQSPLILAGIWETWRHEDTVLDSCTVLTMAADETLSRYHDRMPVFVSENEVGEWLFPNANSTFDPEGTSEIGIHPVSKDVNNGRIDNPDLILPIPSLL